MEIRRSYSFASDGDFYNGVILFIHKAVSVSSAWERLELMLRSFQVVNSCSRVHDR